MRQERLGLGRVQSRRPVCLSPAQHRHKGSSRACTCLGSQLRACSCRSASALPSRWRAASKRRRPARRAHSLLLVLPCVGPIGAACARIACPTRARTQYTRRQPVRGTESEGVRRLCACVEPSATHLKAPTNAISAKRCQHASCRVWCTAVRALHHASVEHRQLIAAYASNVRQTVQTPRNMQLACRSPSVSC